MGGLSISMQIGNTSKIDSGGYVWNNLTAETYYNKLAEVNGADIDSVSLYGITLDTLKEGIDDHFQAIDTAGFLAKITRYLPFIGGTSVTHAVEAINAESKLTYTDTPSHGFRGMLLNGTTQFASLNNVPSDDSVLNDTHMMFYQENDANSAIGMGGQSSGSSSIRFLMDSNTSGSWVAYSGGTGAVLSTGLSSINDKPVIGSRTSSTSSIIYVDGVNEASIATTAGTLPSVPLYIGASNQNNISQIYYSTGYVKAFSFGLGLTPGEALAFNNEIKTLQTLLGR